MKKGFTLIELLIVIAIIGVLTTIVVANFNSAKGKARDAERVSDIGQLQSALEAYFYNAKAYPSTLSPLTPTLIPTIPTDPSNHSSYGYYLYPGPDIQGVVDADQGYCLGATLEDATSSAVSTSSCIGISWCTLSTSEYNYIVCRE